MYKYLYVWLNLNNGTYYYKLLNHENTDYYIGYINQYNHKLLLHDKIIIDKHKISYMYCYKKKMARQLISFLEKI